MKTIYLDNNATTGRGPREVLAAMLPYLGELYGNPSSMHSFGGQVGEAVEHGPRTHRRPAGGRSG